MNVQLIKETPLVATARSAYLLPVSLISAVLFGVFASLPERSISFTGVPIRSRWLILLGFAVLATIPLHRRFGRLESTLPFIQRCVGVRLVVAAVPALAGLASAFAFATGDTVIRTWFTLLLALGVVAARWSPDHAWATTLFVGSGTILIDHQSLTLPVSRMLEGLGEGVALGMAVMAVGVLLLSERTPSGS